MKVLIVGDVVGRNGLDRLKLELDSLLKEEKIDFCIVNGENSASGRGIREKEYNEILDYGADAITMGNHIYYRKEMALKYKKLAKLVIPANVTNLDGNGYIIIEKNGLKYCVINLIGEFGMGSMFENNVVSPFDKVTEILENIKDRNIDYIFVDFHAEATAEKIAMGYFLENNISCVFGTHTHVQTADEKISDSGMAYITDIGMTGPSNSVIGLKKEIALTRFVKKQYAKYECSKEEAIFNAIIIEYDDTTKKGISIKRINK